VDLAADLGCSHISTNLESLAHHSVRYPHYTLRAAGPRRELLARMRDRGVQISLGEGLTIGPGRHVGDRFDDLAIFAELGVPRINTVSFEPDPGRTIDQLGLLVDRAAEFGMQTTLEPCPTLTVPDLHTALTVIEQVARPGLRLLVDTMHVCRSGATPADLARLGPDAVGYIQLSDVPLVAPHADYMEEALLGRLVPGRGELPLLELLSVLPDDVVVGLEIPSGAHERPDLRRRLTEGIAAARDLLRRAPGPSITGHTEGSTG